MNVFLHDLPICVFAGWLNGRWVWESTERWWRTYSWFTFIIHNALVGWCQSNETHMHTHVWAGGDVFIWSDTDLNNVMQTTTERERERKNSLSHIHSPARIKTKSIPALSTSDSCSLRGYRNYNICLRSNGIM